jgi:AcrR family transcriptional regulator
VTAPNVPKPRRRPQQARSQEIVKAIQEACTRILATEGPDAVTTNRIAEVAGVNIASVYRYFPNKEAILAAIYERQLALEGETLDALHGRAEEIDALPLEGTLRLLVDVYAEHRLRLLRMHEDFYRRHQGAFDLGARPSDRYAHSWQKQSAVWLGGVLALRAGELKIDDVPRAAFLVLAALRGIMDAAVKQRPEELAGASFRAEVVRFLERYLRG